MKSFIASNTSLRFIFKTIVKCGMKKLIDGFWRWKMSSAHSAYQIMAADSFKEKKEVKFKSQSFDVWKRLRRHCRTRNASLDMAANTGSKAIHRLTFFKWVKQTRFIRVMANVSETNQWILQKYIFKWRVFITKVFKNYKIGGNKLYQIFRRKSYKKVFIQWRNKATSLSNKHRGIIRFSLAFLRALCSTSFSIWYRKTHEFKCVRIRTESEAMVGRLRASSDFETVREKDKYNNLKKEAGLALLLIALRSLDHKRINLRIGFFLLISRLNYKKSWVEKRGGLKVKVLRTKVSERSEL